MGGFFFNDSTLWNQDPSDYIRMYLKNEIQQIDTGFIADQIDVTSFEPLEEVSDRDFKFLKKVSSVFEFAILADQYCKKMFLRILNMKVLGLKSI